ncbi:MAG: hypothetical protein A2X49_15140 [Lentisphaerae bacterium GWF2_52_8]|nr:MAG: hypothetical protein A2X49_15140 [Lentisphaerae bacterium GWF2_52_8]
MEQEELKKIVSKIEKLPTLPIVVSKIIELVKNPETSASDVNKVISSDQALTAKVLKLVNSAFYGFPKRISTLTNAIVILGFNTVKSLALSASVFDMFSGKNLVSGFDREGFWLHSVGTAVCAQSIAKKSGYRDQEEAFIAGLIHDIGKVVLDQYAPEEFASVLKYAKEKNVECLEAEREVLKGITHTMIGRWLAKRWNLPQSLENAMAYHHRPGTDKDSGHLTSIVHAANVIIRAKKIGFPGDAVIPPLHNEALQMLKLTKEDLKFILSTIKDDVLKADSFIKLAQGKI